MATHININLLVFGGVDKIYGAHFGRCFLGTVELNSGGCVEDVFFSYNFIAFRSSFDVL